MMNKRNTEGYVLAYLLIVITVMGLIAATLMTSTLQVVTAQEKSLTYMQSKYEAMGEIEKAIAQLTYTFEQTNPGSSEGIAVFSSGQYETLNSENSSAKSAVEDQLKNLIVDSDSCELNLPNLSTTDAVSAVCYFVLSQTSSDVSITAEFQMPYQVTTTAHDNSYYTNSNGSNTLVEDIDYSYKLIIESCDMISYQVSSSESGGAA